MLKMKDEGSWVAGSYEQIFEDDTGKQYRQIVAGLAWPSGSKPGAVVVVAEGKDEDPVFKKRHYQVLKSHEEPTPRGLILRCNEFKMKYFVDPFYTDTTNKPMMEELRKHNVSFYTREAPFCDDPGGFAFYISLIQQLLDVNRKILHFSEDETLPARLIGMPPEKVRGTTAIQEFTLVAALGYALSGLETYVYDPHEQAEVDILNAQLEEVWDS